MGSIVPCWSQFEKGCRPVIAAVGNAPFIPSHRYGLASGQGRGLPRPKGFSLDAAPSQIRYRAAGKWPIRLLTRMPNFRRLCS
jgi:hypothetical protein